jgi:two-component system cell cycle sensor histidine kinase/response regulator CckA
MSTADLPAEARRGEWRTFERGARLRRQSIDVLREGTTGGADLPGLLRRLGAVVFSRAADSTLRFLSVEGRCAERMGLSNATLTGDAYSFWTHVDPVDRRRVLAVLQETIEKNGEYRVAYRVEAANGTVYRVREEGAAVVGPDGTVETLEGVILEASDELSDAETERAQADLQESRERFRALAEHSGEMIAEISPKRLVSFASPRLCSELGFEESDLIGTDPLSRVHSEDREHVLAACLEAVRTGEKAEALCRIERADGSCLWAELGGRSFRDAAGEMRGVVTGRNVENRIRVEEAFLAQRLAEARIGRLSRRFVELGSEGLDEAIQEGVEAAGAIGGVDRCYLVAFGSGDRAGARTYVWQQEDLDPWSPSLESSGEGRNTWMRDQLMSGEIVRIPRVRELPDEFAPARDHLLSRGIQSYCVIPVRSAGRVTALLGFQALASERDWNEQELALLRLVAELFASALHRRDVEGALRDGEHRLRALTDGAQDAICESELVRGEILYANPRFYEMLGYDPAEAEGMSAFEFMHPEDLEGVKRMHRLFERGALSDVSSGTLLYRGLHKDGSPRWLEANGRLFQTAKGEARSAAVIRDVTDRQEAHHALEQRLEDQLLIANLARDLLALGVGEIDEGVRDGLMALRPISKADRAWIVAVDPVRWTQEYWQWCADDVPAPGSLAAVDLDAYPHARDLFEAGRELLLTDDSRFGEDSPEARFVAQRGCTALLVIPLLSRDTVIGAVGFEMVDREHAWSDETVALLRLAGEVFVSAISRKRAEEALRESRSQLLQAQKMEAVGTLAGGVAHDFNNQLSVILGNARFVRGEVTTQDDLREAMVDLERAGEHCAQLTRSLLSFSRHVPAEPRSTSVAKVLLDVRELTGPLLSSAIHVDTVAHDELDYVFADRTQLQQVLVNLVVNARDAMPNGGSLSIRTEGRLVGAEEAERLGLAEPGDYVQFVVADSGCGMDPDTLARIFEPFFTTKEPGKGTGLGLATVYGILRESGGTIIAESEPGRGTTFRLLLPRTEAEGEEHADVEEGGVEAGRTLLLVEDEEGVRRLLRRMLVRMGFQVIEAMNGVDALRVSDEHQGQIDVLVSDVSMPHMGGVELGGRLLAARPGLRVLLVSGHAEEDVNLPGARMLAKPFREEELAWALQELMKT